MFLFLLAQSEYVKMITAPRCEIQNSLKENITIEMDESKSERMSPTNNKLDNVKQ